MPVSPVPSFEDAGVVLAEPEQETESEDTHGGIRHYKSLTRYPVSSRRLSESSVDLLNPNKRHERRRSVPDPQGNADLAWEVLYTADRYFVRGDEPIQISLALWRDGEPILPSIVSMVAVPESASGRSEPVQVLTEPADLTVLARFLPNEHWPEHVGEIRVTTTFSAVGLRQQTGTLTFYFTGADRIPAQFTGEFGERLVNGDLAIDVGIEVAAAGTFRVEGNLFGESGPIGWARYQGELTEGTHSIPLVFYGLIFHDANAAAPFVLRQLRGYRLRHGDSPHREDIPPFGGEYNTGGHYALSDFRQEEYESPRKQRMLEHYRDALQRGVELTNPEYTGAKANE